jgi:M6 family metalloprotease-like protein
MKSSRIVLQLLLLALCMACRFSQAHEPLTPQEVQRMREEGTYEERLQRVKRLGHHKLSSGLAEKASFKLKADTLKASGLTPDEIRRQLLGGMALAYPYAAQPELRSTGNVRTLTILIDFQDHRAATELPGMTPDGFRQNIYGPGTAIAQGFAPYESVNAYYRRASENKVNIQGDVLGWYSFPQNRSHYGPQGIGGAPDNQALFNLAAEALRSYDATHDFAQYDNDHDGDIDLVTILYAGPPQGWGSFWWAYRWEFFVNDAISRRFDGKRLKQFVFQFVSRRPDESTGSDFDPRTLLHEMGHAFGLPDYYDYQPGTGPDGGVGGLDMMDHNWGNHNAFSRWLLDWIQPEIIGAGPPTVRELTASCSPGNGRKAIAIFPNLNRTDAPAQELFLVENRFRVGNDGGSGALPSDGLLVWHLMAVPNPTNNDFLFDNSYSDRKLIRLVRADQSGDFLNGERASGGCFFVAPRALTPSSSPDTRSYDGQHTNVVIRPVSPSGEVMQVEVGFLPGSTRSSPLAATMASTLTSAPVDDLSQLKSDFAASLSSAPTLEALDRLLQKLDTLTPEQLAALWADARTRVNFASASQEAKALLQLLLTRWASKDGLAAVQSLLALPHQAFVAEAYPRVMEAWAAAAPAAAQAWYFSPEQDNLRKSTTLVAGEAFSTAIFKWLSANNLDRAVQSLDRLSHMQELSGALAAIEKTSETEGKTGVDVRPKFAALATNRQLVQAMQQVKEAAHVIDEHVQDPALKSRLREFARQQMATPRLEIMPAAIMPPAMPPDAPTRPAPSPPASAPTRSTNIQVIIVSTRKALAVEEDIERISGIFSAAKKVLENSAVPHEREIRIPDPIIIREPRSKDYLFNSFQNPDVRESSTLFCYCKLHGVFKDGRHYMLVGNDLVPRDELLAELQGRPQRLTVLVTDSCSRFPYDEPPVDKLATTFPHKLFVDLFVESSTTVDINSSTSKPDFESAWMDYRGALFTRTFARMLSAAPPAEVSALLSEIDANKNGRYSWAEFLPVLTRATSEEFSSFKEGALRLAKLDPNLDVRDADLKNLREQKSQRPQAYSLLPNLP